MRHPHPPRHVGDRAEAPNEKINHAAEVRARAALPETYTPPAGLPGDPAELLVYLNAGQFTDAQIAYLRSGALVQYEAALAAHPDPLGGQIAVAWRAWLSEHPAPPAGNPFGV